MSEKETGGPAFPQLTDHTLCYDGMTLRDYFAAKAMQGALSNAYAAERYQMNIWEIAKEAYEMADAMLEARK